MPVLYGDSSHTVHRVMELESRYENRESRPEDLLRIRELEREVKHHQIKLKEIEV